MHYFKRNIGDYHKKAGRLNMLQHGAYTLLIDACYDRERFPTRAEAIDWCWASSEQEISAVDFILAKFFDLVDGLYIQNRIVEEIEQYHANAATNARIAQEREAKKKEQKARSVNDASTVEHEPPPNHKPITINQEPETNNQLKDIAPAKAVAVSKPKKSDGRDLLQSIPELHSQVADDYMTARKNKKAGALTQTALAMIEKQASLANITTAQAIAFAAGKGWVGFMASWYEKEISGEHGKTHAERTQDYKDKQAAEFYAPLLDMTDEERKAWGL